MIINLPADNIGKQVPTLYVGIGQTISAADFIPDVTLHSLILMICGGFAGGSIGSRINKKISAEKVIQLFSVIMVFIIGINVYNAVKF